MIRDLKEKAGGLPELSKGYNVAQLEVFGESVNETRTMLYAA